eukprot:jgi/Mesen1/7564/ME000392S06833
MFEAHVLNLLRKYLGQYVRGLSEEALKISVWKGDVVLNNLQLKAEALNGLNLPIVVKAGFLGSVRLKVPWNRLGKDPVIVLLDRIFILAEPANADAAGKEQDEKETKEALRRQIEDAEVAAVAAKDKRKGAPEESAEGSSWIGSLIATVVGNLKISITNVHIRYEDTYSNPGHPFCIGVTLAQLAAFTIDDNGNEVFVTSSALDRLRKALELGRLAVYHNCDEEPWHSDKPWDDYTGDEWSQRFEPGVGEDVEAEEGQQRQYLLQPIGGRMRYFRQGKHDKREPDVPYQTAWLVLNEVALTISEAQYEDVVRLAEAMAVIRKRQELGRLRPTVPVSGNAALWWRYARLAVLHEKQKLRQRISWTRIQRLCQLRRRYVDTYSQALQATTAVTADSEEIRAMDEEIQELNQNHDLSILWRMIAHAHVDRLRPRGAQGGGKARSGGWLAWAWGSRAPSSGQEEQEEEALEGRGGLTEEEWAKIDELVKYEPGQESPLMPEEDDPRMLQLALDVTMERNLLRALDRQGGDVLCGSFEKLQAGVRMFTKTMRCELRLAKYGLSAPEGTLIQEPFDRELDWMLSAAISSCHVTVWRASLDRFQKFLKSGQAASPSLALETAAALQSKLEDVRRQAQEQLQSVLRHRSRFSINLDVDAPKIAVPVELSAGGAIGPQLLLDLGHFTLVTDEDEKEGAGQPEVGLYTKFKLTGTDISVFLVDGEYDWAEGPHLHEVKAAACTPAAKEGGYSTEQTARLILPVLDRCKMAAVFQQMMVVHPTYPTTRIAVWLPKLGFHISPARYQRLMAVMKAVAGSSDGDAKDSGATSSGPEEKALPAWGEPDLSAPVWCLNWAGIGSTVAEWQPRWAVLAGAYLYVLESDHSTTYRSCISLVSKVVVEVPPDVIGGSDHVLAICPRGMKINKVVQPGQATVLRLPSEEAKAAWQDALMLAIYKASGRSSVTVPESRDDSEDEDSKPPLTSEEKGDAKREGGGGGEEEGGEEQVASVAVVEGTQPLFYVLGVLDNLMITVSGQEASIIELRALGGKIEDLLQGPKLSNCRYMARSVLSDKPEEEDEDSAKEKREKAEEGKEESHASPEKSQGGVDDGEDDSFEDASQELPPPSSPESFGSSPHHSSGYKHRRSSSSFFSPDDISLDDKEGGGALRPPSFEGTGQLLPGAGGKSDDEQKQALAKHAHDFVKIQVAMRQSASPDYDGVDMQLAVAMATLEFFVNRPTVAALMDFGGQLSAPTSSAAGDAGEGSSPDKPSGAAEGKAEPPPAEDESKAAAEDKAKAEADAEAEEEASAGKAQEEKQETESSEEAAPGGLQKTVVKGLLGSGRQRVLFGLSMKMERARMYFNKEDGGQLALLEQERMAVDVKTFPAGMCISATLGNLRVCNMLLGPKHPWGWFCDLRDPTSASLVQVEYQTYSQEDEDYPGYESSVTGQLSAVRIVFLYRFIQEARSRPPSSLASLSSCSCFFLGLAWKRSKQFHGRGSAIWQLSAATAAASASCYVCSTCTVHICKSWCMIARYRGEPVLTKRLPHVQLTTYLTALAPPGASKEAAVETAKGGIERMMHQAELAGSPGMHLDIGLDAPQLIMPRTSTSQDYMQLELGHLQVSNQIEWRKGSQEDPAASRDVNLAVGLGGALGPPMVQELAGVRFTLQRPLRDVYKRLPLAEVHIQITKVRAVMSDREYALATECATANMAEPPDLPPSFRTTPPAAAAAEDAKPAAPKELPKSASEAGTVGGTKREAATWTAMRVVIDFQHVELELFSGPAPRDTSLALLQIQGLWVEYRATSTQESEVLLTLPKVSVLDQRAGARPEMRLMIGSALDVDAALHGLREMGGPGQLTMVVMNVVMKPTVKVLELRIQRPRVLVALDFLLAVGEFFVPTLGAMAGKDDERDVREDPLGTQNDIRLTQPEYAQQEEVEWLAPQRQLLADSVEHDEYVYNGCGRALCLLEERAGAGVCAAPSAPLVCVGNGKHLRFKNVRIVNGLHLDECVQLGTGSSYTASEEDGVVLDGSGVSAEEAGLQGAASSAPSDAPHDDAKADAPPQNFAVDIQAVAPELTFYDSTKWPVGLNVRPEKLLRAKMDVNLLLALKGGDTYLLASVRGFMLETAAGLAVVEPLDVVLDYACVAGKTKLDVKATDIAARVPLHVVRLVQRIQADITTALRLGGGPAVAPCMAYDRIWLTHTGGAGGQQVALWKPRAPPGYVIVGHCATAGEAPPSRAVLALSTGYRRVKKPKGYTLIWTAPSGTSRSGNKEEQEQGLGEGCSVWLPLAPAGYVALGCVAHCGPNPPPLSAVYCVREDLLTPCSIGDCLFYHSWSEAGGSAVERQGSIWNVDNSVGTFFASAGLEPPGRALPQELRADLRYGTSADGASDDDDSDKKGGGGGAQLSRAPTQSRSASSRADLHTRQASSKMPAAARQYLTVPDLERIWWDKGSDSKRHVTIWRPQAPPGYAILGDIVVDGFERPDSGLVVLDEEAGSSDRVTKPLKYALRGQLPPGHGLEEVTFWLPVAPAGYVALGCVAVPGSHAPSLDAVRCVRMDLASQKSFASKPLWACIPSPRSEPSFGIWPVDNQAGTFMVQAGQKKPPWRMAYSLAELEKPREPANLDAQIKSNRVSFTVFDDSSGMLTPLADLSVTGIQLAIHGSPETINAVVFTSVAASTYNPPLAVWEPLIEPFDGIFKYESRDTVSDALGGGTHVRITATSVVNVNLASAGVDALAGAALAWTKASEVEQKARSALHRQELEEHEAEEVEETAALDNEESLRLLLDNQLGETLFASTSKDRFTAAHPLPPGQITSLPLARQHYRSSQPSNQIAPRRALRRFMAVRLIEAKNLVLEDDVTGVELVAHLRVAASGGQPAPEGKLMPQTARSRGVPIARADIQSGAACACWDEVFIFEIPSHDETTQLELVLTNQAACAGKGVALAETAIPMNGKSEDESNWEHVKSALAIGQSSWANAERKAFALQPILTEQEQDQDQGREQEEHGRSPGGTVVISENFFTLGSNGHVQTAHSVLQSMGGDDAADDDAMVQLRSADGGPWAALRSVAAVMTVTMHVGGRPLALESGARGGLKYVALRSLAVLQNCTDVPLEVCVCPRALVGVEDGGSCAARVDEVYENQRYQPLMGWGSAGYLMPSDPSRFSSLDLASNLQELPSKALSGWKWTSQWKVDRANAAVDPDGWFYGPDFKSMKSGPLATAQAGAKGPLDFARRRRLVRSRENESSGSPQDVRQLVRPAPSATGAKLSWSRVVQQLSGAANGGGTSPSSDAGGSNGSSGGGGSGRSPRRSDGDAFVLSELARTKEASKREELLECRGPRESSSWWLCLEADAVRLHSETAAPVYDWRITVRAPLQLENRLPCVGECIVWERPARNTTGGRPISRHHGLVNPGEGVHVHTLDIRRPCLLTFLPQGGWKPEKEAVLISDPWAADLPASFWIVNSYSNRRVRVSLENDMGGNEVAAKMVRLFVPYWLRNDAQLPLSYRVVEIEAGGPTREPDSMWAGRASAAAKLTSKLPERDETAAANHKVVKSLEVIEDTAGTRPVMLSLPQVSHAGLSVALSPAGVFGSAIPFKSFEEKMERMELKAVDPNGSYMKLAVSMDLSTLGERTKVVRLQPFAVYSNRLGKALVVRMEGYQWSRPFSTDTEGTMHIILRSTDGSSRTVVCAEIVNGADTSRVHVIFRPGSVQSPYRIENRSILLPIRFRQAGGNDESWQQLQAGASVAFAWEDLQRERLLELMVDGADPATARKVPIDDEGEHEPPTQGGAGPVAALRVAVTREPARVVCVRVSDWKPCDSMGAMVMSPGGALGGSSSSSSSALSASCRAAEAASMTAADESGGGKMFVLLSLDEFGLSIVDHTPEELLYFSMQSANLSYETNSKTGSSRIKVRIGHMQIDNQLSLTAMPVLLAPQSPAGVRQDYVLKLSLTSQDMPSAAWLVNVHEPIIWRLHTMLRKLNLGRLSSGEVASTTVAVDPRVRITLFHMSEGRLKVTLAMAPTQRPRNILGFWSTLVTSLGNTDEMPIRISEKVRENISMPKSQLQAAAIRSVTNDLLSQPFQLLSGLDVLGNASSALGHMSKGVAALSMDAQFIRSRQRQESKTNVEGLGDGLREGGEALAKSLFRGVTGIVTKPMEGARSQGVEGFMSGVGKGLIGVAAQPVSGVLDLVSKTADGVNATRLKLSAAMSAKLALERRRLPRAIRGDNVLRPYDDYSARGQAILQLAERGALFGSALFDVKERGKFAMTDAYEEHHNLPRRHTLMITHRRVILLQEVGAQVSAWQRPVPVLLVLVRVLEPLARAGKLTKTFELVWSDKGAVWSNSFPVSIWRPVPPEGHVSVGDLVRSGYEPPEKAMVYRDDNDGKFVPPVGFDLIWRDTDSGAKTPVTIWMPRAPPGFVALGCVAVSDYYEPDRLVVRCVHKDCVAPADISKQPTWRDRKGAALWKCSMWQVLNDARTFLARRDHDQPPTTLAFGVVIRISEKVRENISMPKSQLQAAAIRSVTNDLLSQPFQLLSGLDVLGNASSALGHMSKGVAALSMDAQFIRSRQRQESKTNVEGLGDGLREGGEALAKSLFRGVTGIVTKPMEGARSQGVEGFMSGVGKGLIGVAAQPVSGVLDLVSKTADGVNATRLKLSAAMSAKLALERRRLPRAIRGDNVLRPYDDYSARGQHPAAMGQKRVDLLKEPCSVVWDVPWEELMTTELKHAKDEAPGSPPSRLVLHLRDWSQETRLFEAREIARTVSCHPGTSQAADIKEAIHRAMQKYGPDRATVAAQTKLRRGESRPYAGAASGAASGAVLGLLAGPAAPVAVPVMATFGALVGGAGQVMLEEDAHDGQVARERRPPAAGAAAAASAAAGSRGPGVSMAEARAGAAGAGAGAGASSKEPLARAGKLTKTFELVWSDKGAVWSNSFPVSIWRPVPPEGHVSVGDLVRSGYEPPEKAMVYRDDNDGKFVPPVGFDLIWRDTDSGAKTPVTIWMPRAPPGFVALGCVAVSDYYEPDRLVVRCVHKDCVAPADISKQPTWRDRKGAALWKCSMWQVLNDARTFLARRDHDQPPTTLAFGVVV